MKQAIHLLLLFLFLQQGHGQDNQDYFTIRFRLLPWDTTTGEIYLYTAGKYQQLKGLPNTISHEYTYTGPNPIQLFQASKNADGTTAYTPYQSLPLQEGNDSYFLILYRNRQLEHVPSAFLYPYVFTQNSKASFVLFNFTHLPIKAKLGSQTLDLNSWRYKEIDNSDLPQDDYSFLCKIANNPDGQWKLIYNDFIHLPPDSKVFFFLSDNPQIGQTPKNFSIRTKKVVDYRLSEETRKENLDTKQVEAGVGGY